MLFVDVERCVGCRACEIACKNVNELPEGLIKVLRMDPVLVDGKLVRYNIPTMCLHCGQPLCKNMCPAKAISITEEGAVIIDAALCVGCRLCLWICPINAPHYIRNEGRMRKCVMCINRIREGLLPACVKTCHMGAIKFGTFEEIIEIAHKRISRKVPLPKLLIAPLGLITLPEG